MKPLVWLTTVLSLGIFAFTLLSLPFQIQAQMMRWRGGEESATPSAEEQLKIEEGKALYAQLKSKAIACDALGDGQFEALGEYFMEEHAGSSVRHMQMEEMAQNMMGENGEREMHIWWGKRASRCSESIFPVRSLKGGGFTMMNAIGWGPGPEAWGQPGFILGIVLAVTKDVLFTLNLFLVALWLFKQIKKK